MSKPRRERETATPGCPCSRCARIARVSSGKAPGGMGQAGRIQQSAVELGWSDGGSDHGDDLLYGHLRRHERADREEREVYGKPLRAQYRHLIGATPVCVAGDMVTAAEFHRRIQHAISVSRDQGGYTRAEWARLYRLRDKWAARAAGTDERFNLVGNRQGGLDADTAAELKHKRAVKQMMNTLRGNNGSK